MQVMFKEKENIFQQCLFDSDENGSEEEKVAVVEPIVYNNPDDGVDD